MSRQAPKYLVQVPDSGELFGYFDPVILRIDIAQNKPGALRIFELGSDIIGITYYRLISIEELKEKSA